MAKRTQAKLLKRLEYRFGKLAAGMEEYYHHLDFRSLDDLDDDGFTYLMQKVKGVDMLDLNETNIGNKSIKLLTGLEYVKEFRAKGCHQLDNGCVPDLNQIPSLELLHLKYTEITIDGLLQLTDLPNLRTLMFSSPDGADIRDKLSDLHTLLPDCELVVDGKPQSFEQ